MEYRLPNDIKPLHYDILLKPDCLTTKAQGPAFLDGEVVMKFKVIHSTDKIVLHAVKEMVFSSFAVDSCETDAVSFDEKTQKLTVILPQKLAVDSHHELKMVYRTPLWNDLSGIYRCTTSSGKNFIASQFEATDARKSIPCLDEPCFKAEFQVSIIADKGLTVLNNMPEISSEEVEGKIRHNFMASPPMSSYLMAFIIAELEYIEDYATRYGSDEKIVVRVYTPPSRSEEGRFSLEAAVKGINELQAYTRHAFPYPKCDFVGVPSFSAGAMENVGLITFREILILTDESTSSAVKERVATVICHELAHQESGNSVTPHTFSGLFLNESFASILEYFLTNNIYPEFEKWVGFNADCITNAMAIDCLDSAHPLLVEVNTPTQINEIFDKITYDKGASVFGMFKAWWGDELFRDVMSRWFTKYEASVVTEKEFVEVMEEMTTSMPFKSASIFETFLVQPGFPLISAEKKGTQLKLSQKRFLLNGDDEKSLWKLPIKLQSFDKQANLLEEKWVILTQKEQSFEVPENSVTLVNPHRESYCRVKYLEDAEIIAFFDENKKQCYRQLATFISDATALVEAMQLSAKNLLSLLKTARGAPLSFELWTEVCNSLSMLGSVFTPNSVDEKLPEFLASFANFKYELVEDLWKQFEVSAELSHTQKLISSRIFSLYHENNEDTAAAAHEIFRKKIMTPFKEHGKIGDFNVDLRGALFNVVAKTVRCGDVRFISSWALHDFLRELIAARLSEDISNSAMIALGLIADDEVARAVAVSAIFGGYMDAQDICKVYGSLMVNQAAHGQARAWSTTKSQWEALVDLYGITGFLLPRQADQATHNFSSLEIAQDIEAFFAEKNCDAVAMTVKNAVARIASKIEQVPFIKSGIEEYFA